MKKLFKIMTLVSILGFQTQSFGEDKRGEVVFQQLKTDLWSMGLNFEYAIGTNFAVPSELQEDSEVLPEELSKILEI